MVSSTTPISGDLTPRSLSGHSAENTRSLNSAVSWGAIAAGAAAAANASPVSWHPHSDHHFDRSVHVMITHFSLPNLTKESP